MTRRWTGLDMGLGPHLALWLNNGETSSGGRVVWTRRPRAYPPEARDQARVPSGCSARCPRGARRVRIPQPRVDLRQRFGAVAFGLLVFTACRFGQRARALGLAAGGNQAPCEREAILRAELRGHPRVLANLERSLERLDRSLGLAPRDQRGRDVAQHVGELGVL